MYKIIHKINDISFVTDTSIKRRVPNNRQITNKRRVLRPVL